MPLAKKTKSNNNLGSDTVIPLRNLVGLAEREPAVILELSKKTRTISRAVQLVLLIIIFSMLTKAEYQQKVSDSNITGISVFYWVLSLAAFGLDLMDLGLYYSPVVGSWSNTKIVLFETVSDGVITSLLVIGFISQLASLSCPPGSTCDAYNTITAFTFFSIITWGFSFYYDLRAYNKIKSSGGGN